MSDADVLVGVVMGSESDLEVMRPGAELLRDLGVRHEMRIMSAHRTPEAVAAWAGGAAARGLRVLIAGAGGAAALPGVVAAHTALPVIGVPIDATPLHGVDALYAIVQMPAGVPVATVGINNAKNAALLAARILALGDAELAARLQKLADAGRAKVETSDRRIREEIQ